MLYKKIEECRICWNKDLKIVLDLWYSDLSGVFPLIGEQVEWWPIELVKCDWEWCCGLAQSGYNYDLEVMYGDNYGYRSGLNQSMVRHLSTIVDRAKSYVSLSKDDLVIDIASNDGTMLWFYGDNGYKLVGIDPTSKKFSSYYSDYTSYISEFFTAETVKTNFWDQKAKIITSIACFYDLERPQVFADDISEILDENGIWILEQSYMPLMIKQVSYDTTCHEHLEYYALKQIQWVTQKAWLRIVDVFFNDINGGSFQVVVTKENSLIPSNIQNINAILKKEEEEWFNAMWVFEEFAKNTELSKEEILKFLHQAKSEWKKVFGYGASTKWNVTLQYCGIDSELMPYIVDVNEYKYGRRTPGSNIPIISEEDGEKMSPDYYFVLPWHFRKWILEKDTVILERWGKFVFPLPKLEIVWKND
jgi:NDP-4-keto-2,6-dideoxyhexose 3-C-methyltransferase